jgi:L-malate glycosyltransferase
MKKQFLTIYWQYPINSDHLYKDVGGIPLSMSKYQYYKSFFIYLYDSIPIHDVYYEKYVTLIPIKNNKFSYIKIIFWLLFNIQKVSVLNLYHIRNRGLIIAFVSKICNPFVKVYVKLDYNKRIYDINTHSHANVLRVLLNKFVYNIYSVECKEFVGGLNSNPAYNKSVFYIPNGFFYNNSINTINKRKNFLTVGRIGSIEKNTELLIQSLLLLPKEILKDWNFLLVGDRTKKFDQYLNSIYSSHPYLKDHIILKGKINDRNILDSIYESSSVFVLTSKYESFGIVIVEAMSHGCMPIVTNCSNALTDIIPSQEYGIIVKNNDVNDLKVNIQKVLENKIDYRKIGESAKKHAYEEFDYEKISKRLSSLL